MKKYVFLLIILSCLSAKAVDGVVANQNVETTKQNSENMDALKTKMSAMIDPQAFANPSEITKQNGEKFLPKSKKIALPAGSVIANKSASASSLETSLNDAYTAYKDQNIEASLEMYKKANSLDPKNIDALFGMGVCYQLLGQSDEATSMYIKILEIKPDDEAAKNNLLILVSGNSVQSAIKELKKMNEKKPNNPFILAQLGTMYSYINEHNDAIFYLGKAIENEPSNPFYTYNMAITFDQMKRSKEAYTYYNHTLSLISSSTLLDKNVIQERMRYIKGCLGNNG
jgi:tetratricopeptide (TPR) repeat protein